MPGVVKVCHQSSASAAITPVASLYTRDADAPMSFLSVKIFKVFLVHPVAETVVSTKPLPPLWTCQLPTISIVGTSHRVVGNSFENLILLLPSPYPPVMNRTPVSPESFLNVK